MTPNIDMKKQIFASSSASELLHTGKYSMNETQPSIPVLDQVPSLTRAP